VFVFACVHVLVLLFFVACVQRVPPAALEEARKGWPEAYDFISKCVSLVPNADGKYVRPTATELLADPFVAPTAHDDDDESNQTVLNIALADDPEELARRATLVRVVGPPSHGPSVPRACHRCVALCCCVVRRARRVRGSA
jgi:hypothetical protein